MILHFSIGPVQGFIDQSRRTRDLWASSFLLSWLSAVAMKAVVAECEKHGGEFSSRSSKASLFKFPAVEDDPIFRQVVLGEVLGHPEDKYLPTLPNAFKAVVPDLFNPEVIESAVQKAWAKLADHVWGMLFSAKSSDIPNFPVPDQIEKTRTIWERQIGRRDGRAPYWECRWVMGEDPKDGSDLDWLDRRKAMRSPAYRPAENGDLCTMMAGWQEISGWSRYPSGPKRHQIDFWSMLRARVASMRYPDAARRHSDESLSSLDIGDQDRLCAIGIVKRLFSLLDTMELERIFGWVPEEWTTARKRGQRDVRYWPSTSYMAAVRWMERANAISPVSACTYKNIVERADPQPFMLSRAEAGTAIEALKSNPLRNLDGGFLHRASMDHPKFLTHLNSETSPNASADANIMVVDAFHQFSTSRQVPGDTTSPIVGKPEPYFALLAADGDEVGKLMRSHADKIPSALAKFAVAATARLEADFASVPIYAGADDVLAFVPIEDALPAAIALREEFKREFNAAGIANADISAAVLYCHMRTPLRWALSHVKKTLLDAIAKEKNGRSSIAIGLQRQSGTPLTWATVWEDIQGNTMDKAVGHQPTFSPPRALAELIERSAAKNDAVMGSNRFSYQLLDRLAWAFAPFDADRATLETLTDTSNAELARFAEAVINDGREAAVPPDDLATLLQVALPHFSDKTLKGILRPEPILILRFLVSHWQKITRDDIGADT